MKSALNTIKLTFLILFHLSIFKSNAQVIDSTIVDSIEKYRAIQLKQNSQKLTSLREELNVAFNKYIEGFDTKKIEHSSIDHLPELRSQLKSQVISFIDNGTSGEAIVAVNKAKIDMLIEEINTIEKYLSEPGGVYTNSLNIFDNEELEALEKKINAQIIELKSSVAPFPTSEVPTELLLRQNELQDVLDKVKHEIDINKNPANKISLKTIDKSIGFEQLKTSERFLEKFKSANKENFYKEKLSYEVELRLHGSPDDAALSTLRRMPELIFPGIDLESISARPPPGKWKSPVDEVVSEIHKALFAEQNAIELRDLLTIAKARTNSIIYYEWLKTGIPGFELNSIYELLNIHDLQVLRSRNTRWLVSLNKESVNGFKTIALIEIEEAKQRINLIEKSIQQKTNSFPFESASLKSQLVRGPPLMDFESKLVSFEKYTEAKELRLMLDKPNNITDINLKTAYENNIKLLKTLEENALINCKGKEGAKLIDQLIETQRLIAENKRSTINVTAERISYIKQALKETTDKIAMLNKKISSFNINTKVIYHQYLQFPSTSSRHIKSISLKQISGKKYPVDYNSKFPKNESWTKSIQRLIENKKKAPGGVIIDAEIKADLIRKIEKAEFNIFKNEISVLIKGQWKKVEITKDSTILRQAWAYVNDGRVAAVDIVPFSPGEKDWVNESVKSPDGNVIKQSEKEIKENTSLISTVNLHPAFQNTLLGKSLILSDQVIFDLLPTAITRIEGEYGEYEKLGLNVKELSKAYRNDFIEINTSGNTARSYFKSIISFTAFSLTEGKSIHLSSKPDFAIYQIPDTITGTLYKKFGNKKNVDFKRLNNSSNWFNVNRNILLTIPYLKDLDDLSIAIAFFNTIKKDKIENNFNELIYLVAGEGETPNYLFSGGDEHAFDNAKDFLKGKIKQ